MLRFGTPFGGQSGHFGLDPATQLDNPQHRLDGILEVYIQPEWGGNIGFEHAGTAALARSDEPFGLQARHSFADDGTAYTEAPRHFGLRGQTRVHRKFVPLDFVQQDVSDLVRKRAGCAPLLNPGLGDITHNVPFCLVLEEGLKRSFHVGQIGDFPHEYSAFYHVDMIQINP
jgi:hypothetical protein